MKNRRGLILFHFLHLPEDPFYSCRLQNDASADPLMNWGVYTQWERKQMLEILSRWLSCWHCILYKSLEVLQDEPKLQFWLGLNPHTGLCYVDD